MSLLVCMKRAIGFDVVTMEDGLVEPIFLSVSEMWFLLLVLVTGSKPCLTWISMYASIPTRRVV